MAWGRLQLAVSLSDVLARRSCHVVAYVPGPETKRMRCLDVRVVIVGQDPYHGPGQAHGLSFSVPDGVRQPPSLRNMIKEAADCCGAKAGKGGNLEKWAKQGVLLLNASLTVQHKKANSHANIGWATFTDAAIRAIAHKRKGVVFLLWGGFAQKKCKFVDSTRKVLP